MSRHHILIVGSGSVGRRHAQNFNFLGCDVSCVDPREDRRNQLMTELPLRQQFATLKSALESAEKFTGVVICSPPRFHVEQSLVALDAVLPVLLEKPASSELAECQRLQERLRQGGKLLLGYTYRWWDPVRRLKSLLDTNRVGAPRYVHFLMSAHLADWHPWEPYQDFFMASSDLGGGALLDESHFIDLMLWFFGKPTGLFARVEKISDLEIATDDFVEISAVYPAGLRVGIHLDLFGRPHQKHILVTGEKGTIQCLFDPNVIRISDSPESHWETEPFAIVRNDMFLEVAREFLQLIDGLRTAFTCTILDGIRTLETIEACRKSQRTGHEVRFSTESL